MTRKKLQYWKVGEEATRGTPEKTTIGFIPITEPSVPNFEPDDQPRSEILNEIKRQKIKLIIAIIIANPIFVFIIGGWNKSDMNFRVIVVASLFFIIDIVFLHKIHMLPLSSSEIMKHVIRKDERLSKAKMNQEELHDLFMILNHAREEKVLKTISRDEIREIVFNFKADGKPARDMFG